MPLERREPGLSAGDGRRQARPHAGPRPGGLGSPTETEALLARLDEAEQTLRAIAAGEIDAFVISDPKDGRQVFTLSTADRPYRMFVDNMQDGAATISASGIILYANQRLATLVGRTREHIVGSPLHTHLHASDADHGEISTWPEGGSIELQLVRADGSLVPVLAGASRLEVDGNVVTCVTFTDLSGRKALDGEIARLSAAQTSRMLELESAQDALTQQATHDTLTGLPNRVLLLDRIDQALRSARRSGRHVAIYFVDLDQFKLVNDRRGHAAGDAFLKSAASRLLHSLRNMDTIARVGGDEFVILAPDIERYDDAIELAARLLTGLAASGRPGARSSTEGIPASIGISVSIGGEGKAETLLHEADVAMYKAKSLGGGRAHVFDAVLGAEGQTRNAGQKTLEGALKRNRLVAYFQPVVDITDRRVVGFEALARIVERNGEVLAPAAFIGFAEESGLVVPLGTRMLNLACHEAFRWPSGVGGRSDLSVAVNLSSRQFEPGDLPVIIKDRLETSGLDSGRLLLELTETAIMALRPELVSQLEEIRDLGVEIGLDDFGTGYASLTHLRRLPVTFVKIDQSFVQGLGSDQEDERIVAAVIDLAANLGLRSIAEGVETQDQLDRLCELGCDQAQGYLFARPAPSDVAVGSIEQQMQS